jgi:hypothetical protein
MLSVKIISNIETSITEAIRQTNRCLFINQLHESIAHQRLEMYALFKTWICREVRKHIGWIEANSISNRDKISISFTGKPSQIESVFIAVPGWQHNNPRIMAAEAIFTRINYKSLFYEPKLISSWKRDGYSNQKTLTDVVKNIDFDSILNIKY